MLVSRQCEAEQNHHWNFYKPVSSPRMSTQYDPPLSTQPDWQGHYSSFLPPGDNIFGQSYEHATNPSPGSQQSQSQSQQQRQSPSASQPRTTAAGTEGASGDADSSADSKSGAAHSRHSSSSVSPLSHRRSLDPLGLRQKQPSPIPEQSEPQGDNYVHKEVAPNREEAGGELPSIDSLDRPMQPPSSGEKQQQQQQQRQEETQGSSASNNNGNAAPKEEEDDGLDDEDMLEGDGDGEEGGDGSTQPQTAAERTAQRRKMKRFRLTHQQTRFLMSEFAKQPHPDAAHRERLSREIPGLSPRQVQVWFQNRRAKIKRLTADDRDRMIKMRAVPDDFDNVQALHSPYGAVHALGTPISSPVDFAGSSYAEHMMRPLMVDVRRADAGDDHLSPTGLSPAFGSIGFSPSAAAAMGSSDMLSPLSPGAAGDRYGYPSHLSSPLSATSRTSNPFARQGSLDAGLQMHGHHSAHQHPHQHQRQQMRPLQPLQLRETMSRSRSDNLQSPLRSSMSWKGDSIDYSTYHQGAGGATSPQRHHSLYQPSADGSLTGASSATTLSGSGYDSASNYSGTTAHSPTHLAYPAFHSGAAAQQSRTGRLRAASASSTMQPLSLDLRSQYRGLPQSSSSPHSAAGASAASSSQRSASGAHHVLGGNPSAYSSFPSAPLTAPIDFNLSRTSTTSGLRSAANTASSNTSNTSTSTATTTATTSSQDYTIPQLSAPIAPPNDFSQAFQARTPIRDSFGGSAAILHPLGGGAGSTAGSAPADGGRGESEYSSAHHHRHHGHSSAHHHEGGVLKRKRSFSTSASGPGSAYGSAA